MNKRNNNSGGKFSGKRGSSKNDSFRKDNDRRDSDRPSRGRSKDGDSFRSDKRNENSDDRGAFKRGPRSFDSNRDGEKRSYSGPRGNDKGGDRRGRGKDFRSGDKRDDRRSGGFRDNKSDDRRSGGFREYKSEDRRSGEKREYKSEDRRGGGFRDNKSDDRRSGGFRDNKRDDRSDDRGEKRPYKRGENEKYSGPRKSGSDRNSRSDDSRGRGGYDKNKFSDRRDSRGSNDRKGPDERRRPRTRQANEKDQKMLGDWRSERPASEERKEGKYRKEVESITEETRLNKFLANSGLCSRRDADDFIENGAVSINGEIIKELGSKVMPGDEVRFKGRLILPEKPVYILMNKPKDCITSSDDPEGRRTVLDIIGDNVPQRIFPVGRLDRNTTGVLLLTNDGDLAQKLTHPSFGVHKIYKAELDKPMPPADVEKLLAGIELEDGFIKPDEVAYVDETKQVIGVEIHSGKNHIVHRMFNSLGYQVDKLDRVSFAGLSKDGLKRGEIRQLTEKEMLTIRKSSGKQKA